VTQAYEQGDVDRLNSLASSALRHWGLPADSAIRLLNLSENATFSVIPPGAERPVILRVGRPDYSTVTEVASELTWIEALAAGQVVHTAPVLRTADGQTVVELSTSDLPRPRPCVAFGLVPGQAAPEEGDLTASFRTLGELAARLHGHARVWQPPPGFRRRRWDHASTIGERGIWGQWQDGIGVGPGELRQLSKLADVLAARLEDYGQDGERFGLVHADLRLANILFDDGDAYVIDFDDCGWSWFMYDLASCLTFIEDRPDVPRLVDSWLGGYRTVTPLAPEAEAIIPTMIMLRRLLVLAWIGSHAETPLAQEEGIAYTEGTCRLAERYLDGDGPGRE
jgi:Ser/Thr protein kinase RdoA (MazF antagonist)